MQKPNIQNKIRVNNFIKVPQVRVIQEDGTNLGIMSTFDALKLAREQGLDLIEINPRSTPPICKIIAFGKFKYDEKKRQNAARKNQKSNEVKELSFSPTIDEHDLNHKIESAREFLKNGDKVKIVVRFKGREVTHPQIGEEKIKAVLNVLVELVSFSSPISMDGKVMSTLISPKVN